MLLVPIHWCWGWCWRCAVGVGVGVGDCGDGPLGRREAVTRGVALVPLRGGQAGGLGGCQVALFVEGACMRAALNGY